MSHLRTENYSLVEYYNVLMQKIKMAVYIQWMY